MEQRCFCPPESWYGRRPATSVRRNFSSISFTLRCRPRRGARSAANSRFLPQRHVRKQRVVLKDVAAMARARRQMHARGAVEQDLIVQQDASFVGAHESGDGIERQRLAGAARTEQHRHAGGGAEIRDPAKNRRNPARPRTACGFAWIMGLDHNAVWRGPKGLDVRRLASVRMASAIAETISTSTRATAPLPPSTAS